MHSIRVAIQSDATAIQTIYAPIVERTAISFEVDAPTVEEMANRIRSTLPTYPYLVAELDGQVIGYAYASQHRAREAYRFSVDITVYVDQRTRRSGVGRAVYEKLLPILKRQGFHAVYAGIALPNAGSVGLHERLGFKHIGTYPEVGFKHDQWHDVGYWRLALNDSTSPIEIVPFHDLRKDQITSG